MRDQGTFQEQLHAAQTLEDGELPAFETAEPVDADLLAELVDADVPEEDAENAAEAAASADRETEASALYSAASRDVTAKGAGSATGTARYGTPKAEPVRNSNAQVSTGLSRIAIGAALSLIALCAVVTGAVLVGRQSLTMPVLVIAALVFIIAGYTGVAFLYRGFEALFEEREGAVTGAIRDRRLKGIRGVSREQIEKKARIHGFRRISGGLLTKSVTSFPKLRIHYYIQYIETDEDFETVIERQTDLLRLRKSPRLGSRCLILFLESPALSAEDRDTAKSSAAGRAEAEAVLPIAELLVLPVPVDGLNHAAFYTDAAARDPRSLYTCAIRMLRGITS